MSEQAQSSGHEWRCLKSEGFGCCECGWYCTELSSAKECEEQHAAHVASVAQAAQPQEVPAEQREKEILEELQETKAAWEETLVLLETARQDALEGAAAVADRYKERSYGPYGEQWDQPEAAAEIAKEIRELIEPAEGRSATQPASAAKPAEEKK
jgi:hypothetical protein